MNILKATFTLTLFAALMMGAFGPIGLYLFSGAVHLLLFGYVGKRALQPLPIPADQRSGFGDALTSTQTASSGYGADDDENMQPSPS